MGRDTNGRNTGPDEKPKPVFERITNPEDAARHEKPADAPQPAEPKVEPKIETEAETPEPAVPVAQPEPVSEPQAQPSMAIPELDEPDEQAEQETKEELRTVAKTEAEARYKPRIDTIQKALMDPHTKGVRWGVVGIGQGGGRIAEQFAKFGYDACVMNTAKQDLAFVELPESHKLFMDYALGGAGKDMNVGSSAIEAYKTEVMALVRKCLSDAETIVVCVGGGGGTGSGGAEYLIKLVSGMGVPVMVLYTLPQESEGAITKANSIRALSRVAKLTQDESVNALIVVDNSKIQQIYPDISAGQFWKVANFDIVNILNMFNTLCRCDTDYDSLDPMDFVRIFSAGNCTIYGKIDIPIPMQNGQVMMHETELANIVTKNLQSGLLADGFDLKETTAGGIIITGHEDLLSQLPAISINFMYHELNELVGDANMFRGLYKDDQPNESISVYTILSGLGLPQQRVKKLLAEAKSAVDAIKSKSSDKSKMSISDEPTAGEQSKMEEMQSQNTAFGRLAGKRGMRRRGGPGRG